MRSHVAVYAAAVGLLVSAPMVPRIHAGPCDGTPERFRAFAVNMGNGDASQSGPVEIVVTRWSSSEERERLLAALLDHGPEALLHALSETKRTGYLRTPNSIGYDLHFSQNVAGEDGGRRVIVVTDREIGYWEAVERPRSSTPLP